MRLRRTTGAGAALAAVLAIVVPVTASAEPQQRVPKIDWVACPDDAHLRCALVPVPLDHSKPRGETITLRLLMRPADVPNRKIGTLFVNPGGPGGSSADFAGYVGDLLGAGTRQRFDIVGIDPRGIRGERNCLTAECGSAPVVCTAQPGDPAPPVVPTAIFPRSDKEISDQLAYDDWYRALCAKRGNKILNHMSTADTARDMDLIRRAVGDRKLTYYGISYGTALGATYAAMYPNNIRALVVDGVIDPVQWTVGRGDEGSKYLMSARLGSGYGAWEALTSAFAECDRVGSAKCPAAGKASAKYYAVTERLKQGDVPIPEGRVNYQEVIAILLSAMYNPSLYPQIMEFVEAIHQAIFGTSVMSADDRAGKAWKALKDSHEKSGRPDRPSFGDDATRPTFHGVACADGVNPADGDAATRSAAYADASAPGFGTLWSWLTSACSNWPGSSKDAFRGPWPTKTSAPLLIVSTSHDPATPISGARALNGLMRGSRMLTVDGWGHGALGTGQCATAAFEAYLVRGKLPVPGAVCAPDRPLFP